MKTRGPAALTKADRSRFLSALDTAVQKALRETASQRGMDEPAWSLLRSEGFSGIITPDGRIAHTDWRRSESTGELRLPEAKPLPVGGSYSPGESNGRALRLDFDRHLTSLREKLIKIGAQVVSDGRYVTFHMAKVAVPRQTFQQILSLIAELRAPPASA